MDYRSLTFSIGTVILMTLTGCMNRYTTKYGAYRPEKAKFTIRKDIEDLRSLDTIPFIIKYAYQTYTSTSDGLLYRDIILFSEDGRFSAVPEKVNQKSETVLIKEDPWLSATQVGFYSQNNDTIEVEYFTNFQGGEYHSFIGSFDADESMRVIYYYQGTGKYKPRINMPYRKKFDKIDNVRQGW